MRKSIAIDLDSTLNNLDEVWIAEYNRRWNDNLTREDMKSWDTHQWVKPECGKQIYDILAEPGFFRRLGIKPHAQEVVAWLVEHYDVYIATAYHPDTCVDKVEWVKEHLPMIDPRNVIFINPKYLLNTDYLIDDGPHNIEAFKQQAIVMDGAWNRHLGDQYPRVYNWLDVKAYFEEERKRERRVLLQEIAKRVMDRYGNTLRRLND